ncbi:VanW family protein [Lacrimispora sp.]|uniref:VanW family protein n=1 Tax=Lacrimispora sp. TaxID=2719234 RepID=UPI002862B4D6|nr:VanW family protein [Lacrimispora sp.]MDR7814590.1 VanW family protein [Lacrimispora sp.]
MKKKTLSMSLAAIVIAAGIGFLSPAYAMADTLPDGIYVGEYNLGGMTEEEASQKIQDLVNEMENQKITLIVDGQPVETIAKDLGFHWSNPEAVSQAASSWQGGNLIKRYLNKKDIEQNHVIIPLETALDDGSVASFVAEKCAQGVMEPKNATITRDKGVFVVTPSAIGKTVDVAATKQALDAALANGLKEPVTATAVVVEVKPAITTDDLITIKDVLGTFSTSFSSSGASRSKNLQVGAGKINGHVLMPGETLSGYECMHPFTVENGYATASAYENGQVVDSIGGGVCQIATTIYNAVLRAELEVAQRQNHSMIVGYVKPSEDAAIAGTYKDIKFTNNYSTPIFVEGYTSGKTLTFTIYGKETRPANRTFDFVSETLSVTDPGAPKEIVDTTMPPGSRSQVQSAHKGMKSRLWKVVYVDGVEQSREILHTDTYNPSKAIIKVGPAAPAVAVPAETPGIPVETPPVVTPEETVPADTGNAVQEGPQIPEDASLEAGP